MFTLASLRASGKCRRPAKKAYNASGGIESRNHCWHYTRIASVVHFDPVAHAKGAYSVTSSNNLSAIVHDNLGFVTR